MVDNRMLAGGIIVAVVVAVVALWVLGGDDNEQAIRHRLAKLERIVEKKGPETALEAGMKFNSLAGYFTDPCTVITPHGVFSGQLSNQELVRQATGARASLENLSVSFTGIEFATVSDTQAEFLATVQGSARFPGGKTETDVQEVRVKAVRSEGEWRFASFTVVEVLER